MRKVSSTFYSMFQIDSDLNKGGMGRIFLEESRMNVVEEGAQ